MSTSMADRGRRFIRTITHPDYLRHYGEFRRPKADILCAIDTIRWPIGDAVQDVGYRLGRRIAVGERRVGSINDAFEDEFQAGYRAGQREGSRVMMNVLRLGYEAGKGATA